MVGERRLDTVEQTTQLVGESLAVADSAVDAATQALELAKRATGIIGAMMENMSGTETPTAEEMEQAAQLFPHWSITYGFQRGEPFKAFTRDLTKDLAYWVTRDPKGLKSLFDPTYFDPKLADIFGTTGGGAFGTYSDFTVHTEPGPITRNDIAMIAKAETHLLEAGFVTAPQNEAAVLQA